MGLKERFANWSRFQTIASVLAKHGFSGILYELGFTSVRGKVVLEENAIPARLRQACEELGPAFVKLGQLLSTRPDLLPDTYIQEFSKLTDSVPAFAFEDVRRIIEEEFGDPPEAIFSELEPEPLAAASIAQVHRATVRETGERIVLKIQRPGIASTVQQDIQILYRLASALERWNEDIKLLNPTGIVKEFQRSMSEELDFTIEAKNLDLFAKYFQSQEGVVFPHAIWNLTSKRVLAMTRMEGTPLAHIKEIPTNVDRAFLAESIVTFFFESIFYHGIFHADAHSGNLLLQTEGRGRLVLLDFGMVGHLSTDLRNKLSKIFLSLVSQDFDALAQAYVEIGEFGRRFSVKDFSQDIKDFLRPVMGKSLQEIKLGELMLDSTRIARKYQVRVPRDLILFYRSIMTLEHIGRRLDPNFEFLTYGQKFARSLVRHRFSSDELLRDLFKTIEGLRSLGTELPGQVRTLVQRLDSSESPLGLQGESIVEQLKRMNYANTLSSIFLVCTIAAVLLSSFSPEHPFTTPLWIGSGAAFLFLIFFVFKRPKRR